ncbi:MAG: DUF3990 domain-containing protein [Kiritimatiellae bacterium]|nr:DUF3990 domain-containing protein [Kiritimatiellia bacterium]
MLLYHGSNVVVEQPRLLERTRALDFGAGFYLTSDSEQATRWARTTVLRREGGVASVSVFEVEETAMELLKVIRFDCPNANWLRFVSRNRNERVDDSGVDVVIGPVANDNTMPVLNLYFKGAYTEEEALRRLVSQKLKDQYAMKTEAAIAVLRFKEVVHP